MVKLNLGSGDSRYEGFLNVDISREFQPDIICDLGYGLPFLDNTIDEIRADNIIEHLSDTIFIMNDIWRVLKHDATVNIHVPHEASSMACADPTHKKIFNEESFYFCSNGEHYWIHKSYGIYCNFHMLSQKISRHRRYGSVKVKLRAIKTPISEKDNLTPMRTFRPIRLRSFLTIIFRKICHKIYMVLSSLKKMRGGIR